MCLSSFLQVAYMSITRVRWLLPFCCVLSVASLAAAQTSQSAPELVLDAGGHTSTVNKVRFTPDGRRLVSVSSDKTVRIWDVRTGETLDVLRPPIAPGPAGMLFAAAVSPDGRWLAVGGFESTGSDHGIYLISLASPRIEAVLRGHTNVILDLAFSPDGRFLASASADDTARLWDVATMRAATTLRGHSADVYALAFSPDGKSLATASLDQTGRIWSTTSGTQQVVLGGQSAAIQAIAWSPNGRTLATGCVDGSVNLWSPNGEDQGSLTELGNHVTSLSFTGDSRRLFYTLGGPGEADGGYFVDLASRRAKAAFTRHENSVMDGCLSPDGALAATADANGEVFVWRTSDGSLVHRLRSRGATPWSAAWNGQGDAIAWGNTSAFQAPNDRGPLEYAFNLSNLEFIDTPDATFTRAITRLPTVQLDMTDPSSLSVKSLERQRQSLKLKDAQDQIRCFTLWSDRTAAVGADFGLSLFDLRQGMWLGALRGHTGTVWAVAPSPDGRYLLSASEDQTLRVWAAPGGRLMLSLFFAGHEWIAWTPEGYYAASPGGERLMGWFVNSAKDQLGEFCPAAQFRGSLYRPEIIRTLLASGGVQQSLDTADRSGRVESGLVSVEQVLPPEVRITVPSEGPIEVSQPELRVTATAHSRSRYPVTGLRLLLDGRPYEGRKGVFVIASDQRPEPAQTVQHEWTVELAPGRHTLAVQAETAASKGLSSTIEVVYRVPQVATGDPLRRAAEESRPPDLYVLAIGISEYPGSLRLKYAAKDAQELVSTFQRDSAALFRNINVKLLTNAQADRHGILAGLTWLRREMTQRDVSILFFSGHGAKDEAGSFYFVPVDVEPTDLLATGVSGSQFKDALEAIPGRVLVMLDACHAGAAGGDTRKAVEVVTDDLVRDLATDDYGVVVMCSSMGREYSMESEQDQHGYFTLALIEALSGRADFNHDGSIYLTEVDAYLSDRIKELTGGKQHPVTTKPATIRSFPLSQP
jgi:WD40 repeat protein